MATSDSQYENQRFLVLRRFRDLPHGLLFRSILDSAAVGKLTFEAWTLYAVLLLWQFPHFMAIAWMYREDYDRAGYLVLPHDVGTRARFVNWQTLLPLLALVPLSLLPAFAGASRSFYWMGALLLSLGFLHYGAQFVVNKSGATARRLLAASIVYLPLLFVLIVLSEADRSARRWSRIRASTGNSVHGLSPRITLRLRDMQPRPR